MTENQEKTGAHLVKLIKCVVCELVADRGVAIDALIFLVLWRPAQVIDWSYLETWRGEWGPNEIVSKR